MTELIPQKEFREWFLHTFPELDDKLNKLFEDFEYDGQGYIPKRLETKEEARGRPSER